jgi:hypothetical protein
LDLGGGGDQKDLLQRKADVRQALDDNEGAAGFVARIITLPPPDTAPHYQALEGLLADKPERLVHMLQTLLSVQHTKTQDETRTYLLLGKTLLELHDVPGALEAFRNASLNHKDPALDSQIADELAAAARKAETEHDAAGALTLYREAGTYNPGNPEARQGEIRLEGASGS